MIANFRLLNGKPSTVSFAPLRFKLYPILTSKSATIPKEELLSGTIRSQNSERKNSLGSSLTKAKAS